MLMFANDKRLHWTILTCKKPPFWWKLPPKCRKLTLVLKIWTLFFFRNFETAGCKHTHGTSFYSQITWVHMLNYFMPLFMPILFVLEKVLPLPPKLCELSNFQVFIYGFHICTLNQEIYGFWHRLWCLLMEKTSIGLLWSLTRGNFDNKCDNKCQKWTPVLKLLTQFSISSIKYSGLDSTLGTSFHSQIN